MAPHVAESERLYLQPLTVEDHLDGYHALNSDERVSRWSHRPPTKTLQDAKNLMLNRLPSPSKPFIENYAIILKPGEGISGDGKRGEMIGVIGIPRLSHDGLASEVGYGITPAFWGKGYASEALNLFVRHYFNSKREFQKETLVAETEPENIVSERVLEKAGFIREELVRDAFEVVDFESGEKSTRDAVPWRFERPSRQKG